jgi:poly-gamma-glutamate capsule biosynthesis protein CapA/YwtB (metallophosphatase superfamily)
MIRLRYILLFIIWISSACTLNSSSAGTEANPQFPHSTSSTSPASASDTPSLSPTPFTLTPFPPTSTPLSTTLPPPTLNPSPTSSPLTTLLFTGVIVPARCVQAAIDELDDPYYLYDEVRQIITGADLAVGTLNATISDYPPHTGCVPTYVLVGGSQNADALAEAGFDVMSVATNHIKNCGLTNCGDRAFFDTLDNLRRVGILPVGAGEDHNQAMQPVVVTINGVRFGFVSLGQIEPMAFAGENTPGIAVLNEQNLEAAINAARLVSDVVIAMPHWGPEEVSWPTYIQQDLAEQVVAAGADLVVGNHTHVVQAVQEIDGVQVFYGLGNFVFDQWPRDHQQGVILLVRFEGTKYLGYEFIPTHVDKDGRVHIAGAEEAAEILERIEQASQTLR